jgi:hypothetical protein
MIDGKTQAILVLLTIVAVINGVQHWEKLMWVNRD